MIGDLDGKLFICIILFVVLCLLFLAYLVCKYVLQRRRGSSFKPGKDNNANEVEDYQKVDPKDITCTDRASLATQEFLGSIFQSWGTIIAKHPLKVILLSLVVVAAFSTGIMNMELTTDPVQLWSAPNSRARSEKDFHDKNFSPFFRTNQLILTAPGRPGYVYDSLLFGTTNFSGLISKG